MDAADSTATPATLPPIIPPKDPESDDWNDTVWKL